MARRQGAKRETSAGGIVFRCSERGPRFLLIRDAYQNWGFPKGHLRSGETPEVAAQREVREETGLETLSLHASLGTIDWYFRFRGELIHKYCHYFLLESPEGTPTPQTDEGITACIWYDAAEAMETLSYANARTLLTRAVRAAPGLCAEHRS